MTSSTNIGVVVALAIAAIVSATDAAAQADPWKLVPAAPTTCYPDDGFNEKLAAARTAIQAEIDKQQKINDVAKQRFDSMDMMEKAQRMQAFMMKDPQAAMKMLQAEQAAGTAASSALPEANESATRLDAELQRHRASFRTAVEQALQPVKAKQKQLIDAKTVPVGEAQVAMFVAAVDHAQYVQLIAQENAAYEKACAPYFGPSGIFHTWLGSYRTEVIEKVIVASDSGDIVVMQMAAMDLPGGGYRSTIPLEQSLNYLQKMGNVYEVRRLKTRPTVELKK